MREMSLDEMKKLLELLENVDMSIEEKIEHMQSSEEGQCALEGFSKTRQLTDQIMAICKGEPTENILYALSVALSKTIYDAFSVDRVRNLAVKDIKEQIDHNLLQISEREKNNER